MPSNIKSSGSEVPESVDCTADWYKTYPGPTTYEYDGNYTSSVEYSRMAGSTTPGFHRKVREGVLIPHTPFEKFTLEGRHLGGGYDLRTYSSGQLTNHRYKVPWDGGSALLDYDWYLNRNQVAQLVSEYDVTDMVQAAAATVNSRGHDSLTFLAELGRVRRLFVNLLRKILRLDIPRDFQGFAANWLEARYGWRTLLFDLESLSDAIKSLDEEQRKRVSERVGNSQSWVETNEYETSGSNWTRNWTITDSFAVSVRGSVTADFKQTAFHFNPVVTGWELVPFSFVIDWVINVGQALQALSFLTFTGQYASSGGVRWELKREYQLTQTFSDTTFTYSGTPNVSFESNMTMEVRKPTPVAYLPQFRLNLDEWKVIDLIALVIQKFNRLFF